MTTNDFAVAAAAAFRARLDSNSEYEYDSESDDDDSSCCPDHCSCQWKQMEFEGILERYEELKEDYKRFVKEVREARAKGKTVPNATPVMSWKQFWKSETGCLRKQPISAEKKEKNRQAYARKHKKQRES